MKRLAVFILVFLSYFTVVAQKHGLSEGKILYEVSYPDLNVVYASALPSEATMIFKDNRIKFTYDSQLMKTVVFSNEKQSDAVVFMDMMGNKFSLPLSQTDIQTKLRKSNPVVKFTNEKKVIAGYLCKRAVVSNLSSNLKDTFEIWFTDAIKCRNGVDCNIDGINGVMLEYYTMQNNLLVKLTAQEVISVPVRPAEFVSPEGYKQTSIDQIMKYRREN